MESAKAINKILLLSLAFGGATLGVGMLVAEKGSGLQKALIGVGTATSIACVTGAVVAGGKKGDIGEENLSKNFVESQKEGQSNLETHSKISLNQTNSEEQKSEADIKKPLPNEQDQQIDTAFYFQETTQESKSIEQKKEFDVDNATVEVYSNDFQLEGNEEERIIIRFQ